jgi:UDP-N-acetylmuramoyl-tripeptide--D-alanyl-D-alanine ligase
VGDMLELGNKSRYYHEQLAYMIKESNLDYCLTFGEHSLCLKQKLRELGYKKAFHFRKKSQIAEFINNKTKGDNELKKRYLIFLKASRNMELEKVIDYLR